MHHERRGSPLDKYHLVLAAGLPLLLAMDCINTGPTPGLNRTFPRTVAWTPVTINTGANVTPSVVAVGDVNVDGLPDVAVGYPGGDGATPEISVFFQVSPTQWQRTVVLSGAGAAGVAALAVGDLSGDSRPDIVAACNGQIVYLRAGDDPVNPLLWFADVIADSGGVNLGQWTDVAIAQIDGLFGPDLVASNGQPGRVSWFRAPQIALTGVGWLRLDIDALTRSGASAVIVQDVNRDNNPDVVAAAASETTNTIAWYRHPGGVVDPAAVWQAFPIGNLQGPTRLAAGDLNRDGRTDVAALSPTQRRIGWYAQPADLANSLWSGVSLADFTANTPFDLKVADLDVNGQSDVIVGSANAGTLRWFTPVNDVRARWVENNLADLQFNAGRFAVGDIDRNGRIDVAVPLTGTDPANDTIAWFQNPEL